MKSPVSIDVNDVSWTEPRNKQKILHPVSFNLDPGKILGIVGPNGAGKSTLLRLLYRYQKPSTGVIKIDGKDIWSMPAKKVACIIAAVLQEQITDFALTVREIVALGRTPHKQWFGSLNDVNDEEIIENSLNRLCILKFADRQLNTLSGGERQRVMVAFSGMIGFIGLMVPHVVRMIVGGNYLRVLPVSALFGAILLLWADIAARTIMAPEDMPIGIVTGLVGGIFFVWLLRRKL